MPVVLSVILNRLMAELIHFRFHVDKEEDRQAFMLNFGLQLELDGVVKDVVILTNATIPRPLCNDNQSFVLPGDGTVAGFVNAIGPNIGETAVDVVLTNLGLKVRIVCEAFLNICFYFLQI